MLGTNVHNVFVHELETTWKRHVQQLLPSSVDTRNYQIDRLNVHEKVSHVPENIPPNITSDNNLNDDVDSSTSLPVNPDLVTLCRSVRTKKPIEWYVAGSK